MGSATQLGDRLLAAAARSSSTIGETLRRYGDRPLEELLGGIRAGTAPPLQSRDDLCAAVEEEAAAHLGPRMAAEVAAALRADPIVPTSNHFGVDTVSESVQSTLLFAVRPRGGGVFRHVTVFGFGSISMNNWSYPMGLRLYDSVPGRSGRVPQRLPVFPNRVKQCAVCAAGPFDEHMVQRARTRLRRMARAGEVTPFCARATDETLEEVFSAPSTLTLQSCSAQSPVVNAALWRRMFRHRALGGELVQLQAESVCGRLLRRDLPDSRTLVHRLLFAEAVRDHLVAGLDGAQACWRRAALRRHLEHPAQETSRRLGTMFFWGLSSGGRRIPLGLQRDGRRLLLAGVDERRECHRVPFDAEAIVDGLDQGRLLPSLFTCFAVMALARGLSCVGGYYQAEYLPVMQAAVVAALTASAEHRDTAEAVAQVPTGLCLAGLQGLTRELEDGAVIPAGPIELAGMGGIERSDLEAFLAMPVRDAYLVAFSELSDVLLPGGALSVERVRRLCLENAVRRRRRQARKDSHADHQP